MNLLASAWMVTRALVIAKGRPRRVAGHCIPMHIGAQAEIGRQLLRLTVHRSGSEPERQHQNFRS
jgi:hypothetical protein